MIIIYYSSTRQKEEKGGPIIYSYNLEGAVVAENGNISSDFSFNANIHSLDYVLSFISQQGVKKNAIVVHYSSKSEKGKKKEKKKEPV